MYLSRIGKEAALLRTLRYREMRKLGLRTLWGMRPFLKHEKAVRIGGKVMFNSFLPPLPSKAFGTLARSIRGLKDGTAVPVSAYVAATNKCRLNCWHCSRAHRCGKDMSRDELVRVIGELQDLGVSIIGFTGGEPLLRPDLEEVIEAVDERSSTLLFTSGDGFTPERAASLKRCGLFGVAISLDHYEAEIHDKRRGKKGSYATAIEAVRTARSDGFYTMIQLVATRDIADERVLGKYLDLASELGVHEIRLAEPMPTGELTDKACSCCINGEQRKLLKKIHIRTNGSRSLTKVTSFAQIEHGDMYGCGAGFQHLYIDASGNVCPCDFTPVSFGNVVERPVAEIWQRMQEAFGQPGRVCFLMRNAAKLSAAFQGELPLDYEDIRSTCKFPHGEELPGYYKMLGWDRQDACGTTDPAPEVDAAFQRKVHVV